LAPICLRIDKFFVLSANDRHPAAVIWGCKVRRGARRALGVGAALMAIAAVSGARADVVAIDLDPCSGSCIAGIDDAAADADASPDDDAVSMSRSGGSEGAGARPDLVFDPEALPPILADGLPSPVASIGAQTIDSPGVSPYAFFETIIDVPHSADAPGLTAVRFTPSPTSPLRDFLSASSEFFGRPPGDIASRRGLPLSADTEALIGRLTTGSMMRTRVTPSLSPSLGSEPPSSGLPEPFGQVGDEAGRSVDFFSDGAASKK
jgi:hypothetical protein